VTIEAPAFLRAVQARLARVAISASATCAQGPGAVTAARAYLGEVSLHRFAVAREGLFHSRLDSETSPIFRGDVDPAGGTEIRHRLSGHPLENDLVRKSPGRSEVRLDSFENFAIASLRLSDSRSECCNGHRHNPEKRLTTVRA
jgi:hypothetical protein